MSTAALQTAEEEPAKLADLARWQVFQDPVLQQLVAEAIRQRQSRSSSAKQGDLCMFDAQGHRDGAMGPEVRHFNKNHDAVLERRGQPVRCERKLA